ncbi:MAG: hypothetical protein ACLFNT_01005 [Spirochaetales bacterium]
MAPLVIIEALLRPLWCVRTGVINVSDIALKGSLPDAARESVTLLTGCIAGAILEDEFVSLAERAGFAPVTIEKRTPYAKLEHLAETAAKAGLTQADAEAVANAAVSVILRAEKPQYAP